MNRQLLDAPGHATLRLFSRWLPWLPASVALTAAAAPPSIDYHPKHQTVILYQQAAFGVIASGTPPLTYQWLKNGVPLVGATNDQIVLRQSQFSDEGLYSIVVSNAEGSAVSTNAELQVNLPKRGDVDFSFGSSAGIGLVVRAIAVQPDGRVLMSGGIPPFDGIEAGLIARLRPDGTIDYVFGNGPRIIEERYKNPTIRAVAVQTDGRVILGGGFTTIDGVPFGHIARLNPDGTLDPAFASEAIHRTVWYSGGIYSLAVQPDAKVLIAGDFTTTNDPSQVNIARLNPDGALDSTFQCSIYGSEFYPGAVYSVALLPNGKIMIGGQFIRVNGINRTNIVRLNAHGTLDESFGADIFGPTPGSYPSSVSAIAVQPDGKVVVGGWFSVVNGANRTNLVRLNPDGSIDDSFRAEYFADGKVHCLAVQDDGKVLVGGHFTTATGESSIIRVNSDGTLDHGFRCQASRSESAANVYWVRARSQSAANIYSVMIQNDGRILIGGDFTQVNWRGQNGIARLHQNGTLDDSFQGPPAPMVDGYVLSIASASDGKTFIAGNFTEVNGVPRKHLARLNADGRLDGSFLDAAPGPDGFVSELAVQEDGKLLISGAFTNVNGITRHGIARLNGDGTLDDTFQNGSSGIGGVGSSVIGGIAVIVVQDDGKILIGGQV